MEKVYVVVAVVGEYSDIVWAVEAVFASKDAAVAHIESKEIRVYESDGTLIEPNSWDQTPTSRTIHPCKRGKSRFGEFGSNGNYTWWTWGNDTITAYETPYYQLWEASITD